MNKVADYMKCWTDRNVPILVNVYTYCIITTILRYLNHLNITLLTGLRIKF